MKCPVCEGDLTLDSIFENERKDPDNVAEMGAPVARVVFYESADSVDFLEHRYLCENGHVLYLSDKTP